MIANKVNKEEIIAIHEKCIGLRVFIVNLGGWYGEIKRVIDENTFEIQNAAGKLVKCDVYDVRGLPLESSPVIQNPAP